MNRRTLSLIFMSSVLVVTVGYGLFEGRKLLEGPRLTVESPVDGSATSTSMVVVSGEAHNIAFLSINGRQAYTDSRGHFTETLSPPPGYTVLVVEAEDRFGRHVSKSVHVTVRNFCSLS